MNQFEGNKNKYDSNIVRFCIQNINLDNMAPKSKFENSHENSHTSQFEDSQYKYEMFKNTFFTEHVRMTASKSQCNSPKYEFVVL